MERGVFLKDAETDGDVADDLQLVAFWVAINLELDASEGLNKVVESHPICKCTHNVNYRLVSSQREAVVHPAKQHTSLSKLSLCFC